MKAHGCCLTRSPSLRHPNQHFMNTPKVYAEVFGGVIVF